MSVLLPSKRLDGGTCAKGCCVHVPFLIFRFRRSERESEKHANCPPNSLMRDARGSAVGAVHKVMGFL